MPKPPQRRALFSLAFKITAGAISGLAALVSILTFARQEGVIGPLAMIGTNVARIRLTPSSDTAWALGDTLSFAALATDTNGLVLSAPALTWSITNTKVAEARSDGSAIATGAGETTILVTAGTASARARVVVHPRAVELKPSADTIFLSEGSSTSLIAVPLDLHGRMIRGTMARWRSFDTTIVSVDSLGLATGIRPGLAATEARLDGVNAKLLVRVTPVLGALATGGGDDQHAPASTPLPASVVVRTLSRQRQPIAGILVRAAVDGGSLESDTVRSNSEGLTRFRWTLGDRPGPQHLTARADEIDSTVTITAEADPVDGNTNFVLLDSLASARAGAALPAPIVIRVTDTLGQVLGGVPVRWFGFDGSRIVGTADRTDSLGLATATWTLGPKVGMNRARLIVGPRNTPFYALTTRSLAGAPARIVVVRGADQRGTVGSALPHPVKVRVTDAAGNPVEGATVNLAGSNIDTNNPIERTDAAGHASLRWSFGPIAGTQRAILSVQDADDVEVVVTSTALPAPAAKVDIVAPSISIVSSATIRVVSLVTDSLGNPITGTVVQPRVTAGSVSPLRATTNAQGRATFTWTLARRQGDQAITVHAAGVRTDATKTVRRPTSR